MQMHAQERCVHSDLYYLHVSCALHAAGISHSVLWQSIFSVWYELSKNDYGLVLGQSKIQNDQRQKVDFKKLDFLPYMKRFGD